MKDAHQSRRQSRRLSKVLLQRRLSGTRNSSVTDVLAHGGKNRGASFTGKKTSASAKVQEKKDTKIKKKKRGREYNRCFCFLNPNIFKK
mmetsp:Transcript_4759/g.9050  ORF Transcript_4759/g.9050 Transcript_4759/m.9050 type:complete len:89 (+) Transcript_4759:938-1204(+)